MKPTNAITSVFNRGLLLAVVLIFQGTHAMSASIEQNHSNVFWQELVEKVKTCVSLPYTIDANGNKIFGKIRSKCSELTVIDDQVFFHFQGQDLVAQMVESPLSDGGDLYNLEVFDSAGSRVASANHIPAFGDVLLGLLLGDATHIDSHPVERL